jgi:Fe-S-cluster containining protein
MRLLKRRLGIGAKGEKRRACHQCGLCCELFGGNLRACRSDLDRWRSEERSDLLERVGNLRWIWRDPATGELEARCPFFGREDSGAAVCRIHATKPQMCRDYPTLAHGRQCVRGVVL